MYTKLYKGEFFKGILSLGDQTIGQNDIVVSFSACSAAAQEAFKGCGGVRPPAGRRYSVIRPIDSTAVQKGRKCGAAVFGALFLHQPPHPPLRQHPPSFQSNQPNK